jgi:hypothetical protein
MQHGTGVGAGSKMAEPEIGAAGDGLPLPHAQPETRPGGPSRAPGLDVALAVAVTRRVGGDAREALVRLRPAAAAVRMFLYVDGHEADAWEWAPSAGTGAAPALTCQRRLPALAPGRHAVTVRAVDATGTWGAASAMVAVAAPVAVQADRAGRADGEALAVRPASAS